MINMAVNYKDGGGGILNTKQFMASLGLYDLPESMREEVILEMVKALKKAPANMMTDIVFAQTYSRVLSRICGRLKNDNHQSRR
jgi:hypothetical protein